MRFRAIDKSLAIRDKASTPDRSGLHVESYDDAAPQNPKAMDLIFLNQNMKSV